MTITVNADVEMVTNGYKLSLRLPGTEVRDTFVEHDVDKLVAHIAEAIKSATKKTEKCCHAP